jgi:broad specificity phosphatase PhoE
VERTQEKEGKRWREAEVSYLFLVRHGQATLDGGPYDQLSDLGRSQARMLAKAWLARSFKADCAYSGSLNRHRQTAQIVAEAYLRAGLYFPEIREDDRFNEIDTFGVVARISGQLASEDQEFRDLAMRTKLALEQDSPDKIRLFHRAYHRIMDAWIENRYPAPDALTWEDYCQRILDTRLEFNKGGENLRIVVFTSGNPIGIYIKAALDLSNSKTLEINDHLYNTNVTTFILRNDRISLISMNDTSHLTDDQRTRV